ncbi:LysR substrate-binding domain-containing protein [Motiliproteus sp. MSK22-1]|uniref:LysR substrate-binding domain-containing protein n=1 Tax=Motiliproteus sp. MSK22-1 TaxID=1897630 RepID=UPI0009756B70|nr:LysR substrate-binding domain-containing protein [Motiliproteus sp. MSK22-1]OMH29110.1 LysR family transcriptional regulator [Motiliproteus sp. MSK22-1]
MFAHLPPLNSIRVFDAAARLKSFKAAASELNVTPTAVSHQIRGLEDRLGSLLFERKTRAIELTEEGEKLAQAAHLALQQLSIVFEEISDTHTTLTLSTTASFAAMWLVPRLENFHQQNPQIKVVVQTGEQLQNPEKDRRIDLVIRYGQLDGEQANKIKLVTETFGTFATPRYLESITRIDEACLIETRWQNTNLPVISWDRYLEEQHKTGRIRQFDQEHHVIQAALAGQGIALVSSLLVQTALKEGWLTEYDSRHSISGLTYYLMIPSHSMQSNKVRLFQNWLIDELAVHAAESTASG